MAKLVLKDGTEIDGKSFGANVSNAGEVVFSTGMVGYPESLTDPSYYGQILVLTYPLIGNYGIPDKKFWESEKIQIFGLIVSDYIDTPSHFQSTKTLADWLKDYGIPALIIKDVRGITQKLREKGTMLGKIVIDKDNTYYDPNAENVVAKVSVSKPTTQNPASPPRTGLNKHVILIDCGAKYNIARCLLERGISVTTVPWDFDLFTGSSYLNRSRFGNFDGVVISNGPGDPKLADKTIFIIQQLLNNSVPTLGVCLGHQLLALAAGGDTSKMKYGHRSQNQPCILEGSKRCYITTQNHGFAVSKIPDGFKPWFTNANDGSNEGIVHKTKPFMSVQFHPEANPGPTDTEWIFDEFLEKI